MTLTELEKLEALYAAATPGRWSPEVWQGNDDTDGWAATGPHQHTEDCVCETEEDRAACKGMGCCEEERSYRDEEQAQEDAKAIAALHNAFPAMAKALREAWVEGETLARDRHIEQMRADRAERLMAETVERLMRAEELNDCLHKERDEARAEIERLQEMLRQAVAERDTDRSDLATARKANGRLSAKRFEDAQWLYDTGQLMRNIIRERDEARAEVEQLRKTEKAHYCDDCGQFNFSCECPA